MESSAASRISVEPEAQVERALDLGVLVAVHQLVEPVAVGVVEAERRLEVGQDAEARVEPASTGRSRSRSAAKVWIVSIRPGRAREPQSARRSRRGVIGSRAATAVLELLAHARAESSAAAFSVNVITARLSASAAPVASISTIRPTSEVVFPVPAPASTQRFSSRLVRISSRTCWSTGASRSLDLPQFGVSALARSSPALRSICASARSGRAVEVAPAAGARVLGATWKTPPRAPVDDPPSARARSRPRRVARGRRSVKAERAKPPLAESKW